MTYIREVETFRVKNSPEKPNKVLDMCVRVCLCLCVCRVKMKLRMKVAMEEGKRK